MLELDLNQDEFQFGTNIKLIGVGGAGGNAIDAMITNNLKGIEFIAANTNIADLKKSQAKVKLQLGKETAKGLGAGSDPEKGRKAAEESRELIRNHIKGADLLFIAAGLGGGTGTGAAPVIAALAKEMEILTIGIANTPFKSEGTKRMANANQGLKKLKNLVDTILVVSNDKLNEMSEEITFLNAFNQANNILYEAAKAITDIIHHSGYINVDFADVQTVLKNKGTALMGVGLGEGDNRALDALDRAINNPLLADINIENAKGVLVNITADEDFKMSEFNQITTHIISKTGEGNNEDEHRIYGVVMDKEMQGKIRVTLIAAGLGSKQEKYQEKKEIEQNQKTTEDEEDSQELRDTIRRIKKSEPYQIQNGKRQHKINSDSQIEIPAFMRKLSN